MRRVLCAVLVAGALVGCGPAVSVQMPGGAVEAAADGTVAVAFTLGDGVRLGTAEECGERTDCGYAELSLAALEAGAGSGGSEARHYCTAPQKVSNAEGTSSPLKAVLGHCPKRTGTYEARISLHRHGVDRDMSWLELSAPVRFTVRNDVTP
jgi:hypothetical protein